VKGGVTFTELDASPEGRAALRRFYNALYVAEFPDPHERESLANMARYLELKERGWYGANNYHVLLMQQGGKVAGGSVFDYLAKPNAGVIEFLFTRPDRRRRGLGRALLDATSRVLERDARAAGRPLRAVVGEMNDPLRGAATPDNMDPFERAEIWGKWGFARLDFPYVQPALSRRQKPVDCLALMARLRRGTRPQVSGSWVMSVVGEYLRWAMRIPQPSRNPQYRAMARFARRHPRVPLVPLQRYVRSARASSATVLKPRAPASRAR
jgi:GNAT superfamily N-acetyltransferase